MKLCYQVATPGVAVADSVTTYQGLLNQNSGNLAGLGYDGVGLMTPSPGELGREEVEGTTERYSISIAPMYIGELFGQLGLSYTSPEEEIRREAIKRTKEIIDFAGYLGVNISISRVRGQYCARLSHEQTEGLAVGAFRELTNYATPGSVAIVLETVAIMQTNFINALTGGARVIERVDRPNFRLMMDVFHLNLEERDLYQAIRDYSKYSIHIYLAGDNHRYPSHCGLDFEKILTASKRCGCDDNFYTGIFQTPSMKEAARGAMTCLGPITERVYGREAAGKSGV